MTDLFLENGDVKRDARGFPQAAEGVNALIQRALIRLSVKRGSFTPDPALGSLLHTVASAPAEQRNALALSFARQALAALPEVSAESAACTRDGERLKLTFGLRVGSEVTTVEVMAQ